MTVHVRDDDDHVAAVDQLRERSPTAAPHMPGMKDSFVPRLQRQALVVRFHSFETSNDADTHQNLLVFSLKPLVKPARGARRRPLELAQRIAAGRRQGQAWVREPFATSDMLHV
jgi:hypothetical protein